MVSILGLLLQVLLIALVLLVVFLALKAILKSFSVPEQVVTLVGWIFIVLALLLVLSFLAGGQGALPGWPTRLFGR